MSDSMNNKSLSRRDFIKISAVAGTVLAGGKLLFDLIKDDTVTVKETRLLMGTLINLAVVAESKAAGEAAVTATFSELERQIGIFTHREADSPVAVLNRTGKLAKPPLELVEVLLNAVEISKMTGGAFDVTIKPLVDLYFQLQPDLPKTEAIESAIQLVNYTKLFVSTNEIVLGQPGMAITLDGIAKGYIVDAGTNVLKRLGYDHVYIEAGGDLLASGTKRGDIPWKIGIRSPRDIGPNLLAEINITDQAVATSGDYFQFFSGDLRHHHIIDPSVGFSALQLSSVTVVAPTAMLADGLATALMVMDAEAGLALIEDLPMCEAYFVSKTQDIYNTSGFPKA